MGIKIIKVFMNQLINDDMNYTNHSFLLFSSFFTYIKIS